MGIYIAGTGSYVPEKILTNADLEKMVDTSDEWIKTRTGIAVRHIAADHEACSDLGFRAAQKALETAGITADQLSAVIVASTTPDYMFPNTAALIQHRLGGKGAFCFDLSAACCGFISALQVGCSLFASHRSTYKYVLVIGSEKLSSITNWQDRNTCVLFGDGAGAVVLANSDAREKDFILADDFHADGALADILIMPAGGSRNPASCETVEAKMHTIHMSGKETFKNAVNAMTGACRIVMADAGISSKDVKLIIPHQANTRIIHAVAQRLELDDCHIFSNIESYGNTSAASIAICLDEAARSGRLVPGDLFLLTSFGSGLTWGAMVMQF